MLKSKLTHFYAAVDLAKAKVGASAPMIADEVIATVFPRSYEATRDEGSDDLFRRGVIEAIKRYIVKPPADERQRSLSDLDPDLLPYVEPLNRSSYFVPSDEGSDEDEDTKAAGFYVPIVDLVGDLAALKQACDFLFRKSNETRKDALRLRELIAFIKARG